jgi:hypothetical protein
VRKYRRAPLEKWNDGKLEYWVSKLDDAFLKSLE